MGQSARLRLKDGVGACDESLICERESWTERIHCSVSVPTFFVCMPRNICTNYLHKLPAQITCTTYLHDYCTTTARILHELPAPVYYVRFFIQKLVIFVKIEHCVRMIIQNISSRRIQR